jgi:hypothetical protein
MQLQQFCSPIRSYERFASDRVLLFRNHLFLEHAFCSLTGEQAQQPTSSAPAWLLERHGSGSGRYRSR